MRFDFFCLFLGIVINEDRWDIKELQEEEAVHGNRRLRLGIPERSQQRQRQQQQEQNPELYALHAASHRRRDLPDGQEEEGSAPQSPIGSPYHTVLIRNISLLIVHYKNIPKKK